MELQKIAEDYQMIVGVVMTVAGGSVAFMKGISTMYGLAMSSPIEIALMKKKEQYKYNLSNHCILWGMFTIVFISFGLLCSENQRIYPQTVSTINSLGFILSGVVMLVAFACWGVVVCWKWAKNSNGVKKKIKIVFLSCVAVIVLVAEFVLSNKRDVAIIMFFSLIIGLLICVFNKTDIEGVIGKIRKWLFISTYIFWIGVSNEAIWLRIEEKTVKEYIAASIVSSLLAVLLWLLTCLILNYHQNKGKARVMYYDSEKHNTLYLYFKYDDECLVAGEEKCFDDCKSYYLVNMEKLLGERLEKVSDRCENYNRVYSENIILQVEEEYNIAQVMNRVAETLKGRGVDSCEYGKTKIYIKPKDKKVYFSLPSNNFHPDEQFIEM